LMHLFMHHGHDGHSDHGCHGAASDTSPPAIESGRDRRGAP
jgi:hypothetical protein